jgi:transcription termination factor NusB
VEYIVHKTPIKIVLNEMIEIAKRYGDEGAPKLINGIGHKVIESLTV